VISPLPRATAIAYDTIRYDIYLHALKSDERIRGDHDDALYKSTFTLHYLLKGKGKGKCRTP